MISFSVATSQLHESFSLDLPASVWSHRLRRVRDAAFHVHSSPPEILKRSNCLQRGSPSSLRL